MDVRPTGIIESITALSGASRGSVVLSLRLCGLGVCLVHVTSSAARTTVGGGAGSARHVAQSADKTGGQGSDLSVDI